jgi:anthranilate phosphoribosyltransferase
MSWNEDTLRVFGQGIQRLIQGRHMSRFESYEMFRQVFTDAQPDLHQGAFLAALTAKGETPQEIAGAWQAISELDTNRVDGDLGTPLVENCGTGMDALSTFNVSSAASLVAAAAGVRLARHGARALTSSCGTIDLFEELGLDVECEVELVARSVREQGIGLFNGTSSKVHPRALGRILSQIRFGSTLNIAASLASPCRVTHALRGVSLPEHLETVAEVMHEIGYQRAWVVHGYNREGTLGMDELSTLGKSKVLELSPNGSQETFQIVPEDVGLRRAESEEIAALGDRRQEAHRFLQVLATTGHQACQDITCLNAGAILYVAGASDDLSDGVAEAREILRSGAALAKLQSWIECQADDEGRGRQRLMMLAEEAGVVGQRGAWSC